MQATENTNDAIVFEDRRKVGWQATALIVGGGVLLFIYLIVVMLMFIQPPGNNDSLQHGIYGVLFIMPVLMSMRAWILLARTIRVTIDGQGIRAEGLVGAKSTSWGHVAEVSRKKDQELWDKKKLEVLEIRNAKGKRIFRFTSRLEGFEDLFRVIAQRSEQARGAVTYDPRREDDKASRKEGRLRWVIASICAVGLCLFGWLSVSEIDRHATNKRLQSEGTQTEAQIDRHYLFNGVPRIEYTLVDQFGHGFTNNVLLERWAWDELEYTDTVRVVYLPDRPDSNRPVQGMVEGLTDTKFSIPAGMIATLFCVVGLLVGLIGVKGVKRVDGRIQLQRFGEIEPSDSPPTENTERLGPAIPIEEPPPTDSAQWEGQTSPDKLPKRRAVPLRAGLIAIGVLNLLLGLVGASWHAMRLLLIASLGGKVFELEAGVIEVPKADLLFTAEACVEISLSLLLAVSAIGLFRRMPWGRWSAVTAAAGKLGVLLIALVVLVATFPTDMVGEGAELGDAYLAGWFGGFVVLLATGVYPLILLVVLGRRSAAETFRRSSAEA